ncbi:hypothetical protein MRS44_004248 [Fusarium solani]|uniref:uncharacterized protein n=1 Tax=Fusarium solani TaxID=169388 RepID=UPI0032C44234|nr:hypothetical protein MRS44_004248 [Fusarium solani]
MPDLRLLFPELSDFGANKGKEPHHVILAWLMQQSGQPSAISRCHHLNILDKPTPGTGTWILSTEQFQRWNDVSSSNRFLFMLGTLGSGKSTLIYVIIDALEKEYRDSNDVICIYLLFHKADAKVSSAASIWEGLLLQLLQNLGSRDIADELKFEFNKYLGGSYSRDPPRYLELFKKQAKTFTAVYLVIDGLDSCPNSPDETTQQEVLNAIKDLPGNVRTLVSSRTELGVHGLKTRQTLVITPREDDISAYVKARIESDENLLHVLKEDHEIDLVTRSVTSFTLKSGMFLLARLHLDTLSKCGTLKSVKDALDQLPEDLDEAFEGAINQIKKRRGFKRDLANHALTWIVHAKDDLTIKQIEDSFAFHESKGDSWQNSQPRKHSPVSVCAGLVVEDRDKGTLRLVHESVKRRLEGGNIIYEN